MAHADTPDYIAQVTGLEPLLTLSAVCRLLGISKPTLYRLVRRGEIKATRVGDRLRFVPADLREYVERHREEAAVP